MDADLNISISLNKLTEAVNLLTASNIELKNSHEELKLEMVEMYNSNNLMSTKMNEFDTNFIKFQKLLDKQAREKNVILFDFAVIENENKDLIDAISDFFVSSNILIPDVAIVSAYRIGKLNVKPRPIIVKFISERWVRVMFANINKIKSAGLRIANDLSKETRLEKRKMIQIVPHLRTAGYKILIKSDFVLIDGVKFHRLSDILEKFDVPVEGHSLDSECPPLSSHLETTGGNQPSEGKALSHTQMNDAYTPLASQNRLTKRRLSLLSSSGKRARKAKKPERDSVNTSMEQFLLRGKLNSHHPSSNSPDEPTDSSQPPVPPRREPQLQLQPSMDRQ